MLGYILIAIAIGVAAGRIAVVRSKEGDTAFLSANDRSRWCTVAALVEDGTYAIDRQLAITDATGRRHPWSTIDRVRHLGPDGKVHDYSSKPPLLSTMVAGVYWLVHQFSPMTLTDQPVYVARIVLALVNLPMLLVLLVATWQSLLDCYAPDTAKLFGLSVACFGTALLPMSTSLNNHLPAAMSTAVVLMIYLRVAGLTNLRHVSTDYFVAGLFAAFAVVNELPALAMLVAWTLLFFRQQVTATAYIFLPSVVIVAAAFFVTNFMAHQSLRPPYMHRSDGRVVGTLETTSVDGIPTADEVSAWLKGQANLPHAGSDLELTASSPQRLVAHSHNDKLRYALTREESDRNGSGRVPWQVRKWDHWYDYPDSYWTGARSGVDRGEESRLIYIFNTTFGHYGLFSLTPVWLLLPIGLRLRLLHAEGKYRFYLAAGIAAVSLICFAFYLSRPLIDRNYGGVSSSFRWMLWFMPLWVWAMMPAVTAAMVTPWARRTALVLLALSVFSAATALDNPWQHPWIYRYLSFLGWIEP